ncbi:hypothetical protein BpHYR1_031910 [Brachionus plicatilis]|uniref:MULE transposase domain-containing protein n=1 Tax=Brachionus plicatilis TaxID=10195 RepID=A0A3M7R9K0_BRAPC|nr:hypothetical protein BpHYR1_031910 [Brachionus plicatilis]
MVGTTDKSKSFVPFGLLLSKHETHEDFSFLFKAVKDLSKEIYNCDFNKRVVCWSHVERHIKDNLKGVQKDTKQRIKNDLVAIQCSTIHEHFETVWKLFSDKWFDPSPKESLSHQQLLINEFLNYFSDNWLGQYTCSWYEEYARGIPSTDNALESTNNVIKEEATQRELLPINEFLRICGKIT